MVHSLTSERAAFPITGHASRKESLCHGCVGVPFNLFMPFMVKSRCILEVCALRLRFFSSDLAYGRYVQGDFVVAINAQELIQIVLLISHRGAGS